MTQQSPPKPKRVQMTRKEPWRHKHPDAVIVDRRTRYGNPYRVGAPGVPDKATAVALFREHIRLAAMHPALPSMELVAGLGIPTYPSVDEIRADLGGRDLACWCRPSDPCHVEVLLPIANPEEPTP